MEITDIKDPKFLKGLTNDELAQLSDDIRNFLIDSVSKTGGHLSSNLGVVELTVALHYVFDAPIDKLLFDVGHQSYTHKILTGRANRFNTLRQYNGLSGFQKRNESIYDCFEAGHSSTALSSALGMAVARDLNNDKYEVIGIVGDASISSGMSLEALNQIGFEKRKVIIIFNDNNMSISKNVGALSRSFAVLRNSKQYNSLKDDVKDFLMTTKHGETLISSVSNIKKTIKNTVVNSGFFKDFDIDYIGPIDGHNIKDLIRAFEVAKDKKGPVAVHVVTQKGKGYKYAENDNTGAWHGVGKFNTENGQKLNSIPEGYKSYSKIVADKLEAMMKDDENIVAITPAMISGSELNSVFATFPERAFDCGITEDHTVCFASGLALSNKKPFVSVYSSFLQRAYDQLNHDICRMDLPVVIGIDRAGLVGDDGETHHGVFDISMIRPLPNAVIAQGKDSKEIEDLLYTAFNYGHPFFLRYPRGIIKKNDNCQNSIIPIGKWEYLVNKDNEDAIIITYGNDVEKIREYIENNGLNISLINARFIKPIDEELLSECFNKNKPIYVYTCDIIKGGLGDDILEMANSSNFKNRIEIIGIDDVYVKQGSTSQLKSELKIDIKSLFEKLERN